MKNTKRLCDLLSVMWNAGLATFDLDTLRFTYVTQGFMKLTGISQKEIEIYKSSIYARYLHPQDYKLIRDIYKQTLSSFYSNKYSNVIFEAVVNYNLRIRALTPEADYKNVTFSLKISSFESTEKKKIGLMVCRPETLWGAERVSLQIEAKNKKLFYSVSLGKYVSKSALELRPIELDILRLSSQGMNETRIAKTLGVKTDLIKYYKKNIYNKLYVSNISSAVHVAALQNLI